VIEPPAQDRRLAGPSWDPRIRWGLPDVVLAWAIGVGASLLAGAPFVNSQGKIPHDVEVVATLVLLLVQSLGVVAWLAYTARQKGLGTLATDFGLRLFVRDWPWVVAGLLLGIAATLLVVPVTELANLKDTSQDVAQTFEDARGLEQVLFAIGVVTIAPVAEELLFRGALLRGLLRRTAPPVAIFVSALLFALVHVVGDPGTGYYVTAFLALGLVSGWRAWRTGSLSQSIALHAGFNLLAVIGILTNAF
jgi:membrane protease YdiL (CAAX protease family)